MSAREQILGDVRQALGRDAPTAAASAAASAAVARRLSHPKANLVPARGRAAQVNRTDQFIAEAERVNATTARVSNLSAVPEAVVAYLREGNLPMSLKTATDSLCEGIPWASEPLLAVTEGRAQDGDMISLTSALAGVAETGTLVLASGPDSPTTLNFLPEIHIVVVPAGRIVGSYEEAWGMIRRRFGAGQMPRAVNWITGPSRTADIEQTLLLGAHGPKRLHIIVIDSHAE